MENKNFYQILASLKVKYIQAKVNHLALNNEQTLKKLTEAEDSLFELAKAIMPKSLHYRFEGKRKEIVELMLTS